MKLHNYEVTIPEGHEAGDGYVTLAHNTQYTLRLSNHSPRLADAEVFIDGQRVGEWRVKFYSDAVIERPVHDTGRFTFFRLGSEEASAAGLRSSNDLGLIKVVFKPRKEEDMLLGTPPVLHEGGTGLSGRSQQKFSTVAALTSDPSEHVTIHLRLGAKPIDARPLSPRSSPVPPPLR